MSPCFRLGKFQAIHCIISISGCETNVLHNQFDFATKLAFSVRILFNPSLCKHLSNWKLRAISSSSCSLFPLKCSAHSFTKNSETNMLRDKRPMRSVSFHTGDGYRFWNCSGTSWRMRSMSGWQTLRTWESSAPQASMARRCFFAKKSLKRVMQGVSRDTYTMPWNPMSLQSQIDQLKRSCA